MPSTLGTRWWRVELQTGDVVFIDMEQSSKVALVTQYGERNVRSIRYTTNLERLWEEHARGLGRTPPTVDAAVNALRVKGVPRFRGPRL